MPGTPHSLLSLWGVISEIRGRSKPWVLPGMAQSKHKKHGKEIKWHSLVSIGREHQGYWNQSLRKVHIGIVKNEIEMRWWRGPMPMRSHCPLPRLSGFGFEKEISLREWKFVEKHQDPIYSFKNYANLSVFVSVFSQFLSIWS